MGKNARQLNLINTHSSDFEWVCCVWLVFGYGDGITDYQRLQPVGRHRP